MFSFKEVEPTELKALLDEPAGKQVRLFDVRTPPEVRRGAIPGAENVPLHLLPIREGELGGAMEDGHPLWIFYCQSGGRSAQACALLASRGYRNVCNLRGGIMGWIDSGGRVS